MKSHQTQESYASKSEEELLRIVQRQLPKEEQARINDLRQKNENGAITEAEYREFLKYIE